MFAAICIGINDEADRGGTWQNNLRRSRTPNGAPEVHICMTDGLKWHLRRSPVWLRALRAPCQFCPGQCEFRP
jgi:hypothetical protein